MRGGPHRHPHKATWHSFPFFWHLFPFFVSYHQIMQQAETERKLEEMREWVAANWPGAQIGEAVGEEER